MHFNRERVKMFNEALSVFNEVFPLVNVKKRSRVEGFSNDRSSVMLNDRSVLGPSVGKVGVQGHHVTGGFELDQQKSEERTKSLGPNKRPRTSMVDVKVCVRFFPHDCFLVLTLHNFILSFNSF